MTLQTMALFSFLEVAYLSPLQYLMSALQYLIPFNIITARMKSTTDYQFTIDNFYKLNQYFIETGLLANSFLIGIAVLITFVLVVSVFLFKKIRQRAFG